MYLLLHEYFGKREMTDMMIRSCILFFLGHPISVLSEFRDIGSIIDYNIVNYSLPTTPLDENATF